MIVKVKTKFYVSGEDEDLIENVNITLAENQKIDELDEFKLMDMVADALLVKYDKVYKNVVVLEATVVA